MNLPPPALSQLVMPRLAVTVTALLLCAAAPGCRGVDGAATGPKPRALAAAAATRTTGDGAHVSPGKGLSDDDPCDPVPACPPLRPLPALESLPQWPRIQALLARPPEQIDVAELNLLVSQARDPSVNVELNLGRLDAMATQLRATLPARCNHRCRLAALNRYLFETMDFRSEFDPSGLYRDIDRDLLDRVLDSRSGYCEGLSVLYLALGRRLGVPLAAVNARQHMYVRYVGAEGPAFDIDTTQEGRPPRPEPVDARCHAAPRVYNAAMDNRQLAGQMFGMLGIAGGFVSLPWLDLAVSLSPDVPELRNNRGLERARRLDTDGALAEYRAARTLDPCVPLYAMNEARLLHSLDRATEARALVDDFEARYASGALTEGRFFITLTRASFAFEDGRDEEADRLLEQALLESDGAPAVREAVAAARTAQGRTADAVREMRTALLADPTIRTRVGLVLALLEHGELRQASAQLDRVARDGAPAGSLDLHVALVAASLGRTDEATAAARRCLARHGLRCARALVALGDVARQRGNPVCARRYYEAYLACPAPRARSRGFARVERAVRARIAQLAGADGGATVATAAAIGAVEAGISGTN